MQSGVRSRRKESIPKPKGGSLGYETAPNPSPWQIHS